MIYKSAQWSTVCPQGLLWDQTEDVVQAQQKIFTLTKREESFSLADNNHSGDILLETFCPLIYKISTTGHLEYWFGLLQKIKYNSFNLLQILLYKTG